MATEWSTWPRATDEELRSWSAARGDDAGRAARSHADLTAENQALRERAEAAEKERDASRKWEAHYHTAWEIACKERWEATDRAVSLEKKLTAARRAEAAAWNDAIEAAAEKCRENSMSSMAGEKAIRALRRAAPTEGEA